MGGEQIDLVMIPSISANQIPMESHPNNDQTRAAPALWSHMHRTLRLRV